MKVLHFADAHIGVDSAGSIDPITGMSERVLDYLDTLDAIIDFAESEQVDLSIFAGDAFHRHNPHPMYQTAFAERVRRLKNIAPLVMLVGNHDMSPTSSAIEIYGSLGIEGVTIGNRYEVHVIDTKSGPIQVATAPYPSRRTLDCAKEDLRVTAEQAIYALGEGIDDTMPSILVGHFSVSGASYGVERGYVLEDESDVDIGVLADTVWDYVALGHLHTHQCLNDNPPVVYSGSIERVSFNEEKEPKGFIIIDIAPGRADWEYIELDARPYVTIRVKTEADNPTKKVLQKLELAALNGAIVKVIVQASKEALMRLDKRQILTALEHKHVFSMAGIVMVPLSDERDNGARMDADIFNVGMTPDALVEMYMRLLGKSDAFIEGTLPVARDIINTVNRELGG